MFHCHFSFIANDSSILLDIIQFNVLRYAAFILQKILNVKPSLDPEEVFDSSNKNYKGPDLPTRFQDLVLPHDWYIPGRNRSNTKKKRVHRASHGKISFTDLSKRIAASWRSIDGETKLFCAEVSEVGSRNYRALKCKTDTEMQDNCACAIVGKGDAVRKVSRTKVGAVRKQAKVTSTATITPTTSTNTIISTMAVAETKPETTQPDIVNSIPSLMDLLHTFNNQSHDHNNLLSPALESMRENMNMAPAQLPFHPIQVSSTHTSGTTSIDPPCFSTMTLSDMMYCRQVQVQSPLLLPFESFDFEGYNNETMASSTIQGQNRPSECLSSEDDRRSSIFKCVDMNDDEIYNIWKSTP